MFCYQCQEALGNKGCTVNGVCGKTGPTADLQDVLVFVLKGISFWGKKAGLDAPSRRFLLQALFSTITNGNFSDQRMLGLIRKGISIRDRLKGGASGTDAVAPESATWIPGSDEEVYKKGEALGVLSTEDVDIRSLRELLVYGIKGIAAYAEHALVLGYEEDSITDFIAEALTATEEEKTVEELVSLVMRSGEVAVVTMALLDKANTETYGSPEVTKVNIGVRNNPGILISGHDLKDMEELLEQTQGKGVDVYTHSEMLPANYYPSFKKYENLVGNYGSSWWNQEKEFASFNGPILMTTNCITPVRETYKDRIFTTGVAGYPGVKHIQDRTPGGKKDFSEVIELAKKCLPPEEIEKGEIIGGFAHAQVMALADKVVEAVKSGAIKRFVVMAGCDGRQKGRSYFTEVASSLPEDAVILTAGCAKYRYNKLGLGDIGGIPRILDAGQCNDSYSLAVIALKLKEAFGLDDINELPVSFDIAWYEQKAVAVLLALLSLGVKGIRLGPTLPAFLSENVAKVLVDKFDIKPTGDVEEDVTAMMAGL